MHNSLDCSFEYAVYQQIKSHCKPIIIDSKQNIGPVEQTGQTRLIFLFILAYWARYIDGCRQKLFRTALKRQHALQMAVIYLPETEWFDRYQLEHAPLYYGPHSIFGIPRPAGLNENEAVVPSVKFNIHR